MLKRLIKKLLRLFGLGSIKAYTNCIKFIEDKYLTVIKEYEPSFQLPPKDRVKLLSQLIGIQVKEALFLLKYLNYSLPREGDVCEFGIAQGATSALLANEIQEASKTLWLFDSFRGLPRPTSEDLLIDDLRNLGSMDRYEGELECSIEWVRARLKAISFSRAKIIPGFVQDTLKGKNLPEKICFAFIDFDLYESTLLALEFVSKRLSKGGFVAIHDYKFFSSGVEQAVKEFSEKHDFAVFSPVKYLCILSKQ